MKSQLRYSRHVLTGVAVLLAVVGAWHPARALRVTVPVFTPKPPSRFPAALSQRIAHAFRVMHAFTNGKAVEVCDARVSTAGTAHELAKRIGVPLWALERVNPGRDLSKLHWRHQLRIPVLTNRALDRCFTPVRPWVARPGSGPPFYW